MDKSIADLIGAQEVVKILGWPEHKVYRFTREHKLPYKRQLGRVYLYSRVEIEALRDETLRATEPVPVA